MTATLFIFLHIHGIWAKISIGSIFFQFFIGVFIAFLLDYIIIKSEKMQETGKNITAVILFIIMGAIFILFTFAPPLIPLFKDPITSSYGI